MSIVLKKGMLIKVKTTTKDDVFGTVVYEITAVGLPNGGVMCSMLHGTGKAARLGYPVLDTEENILGNIAKGITQIVPESEHEKNRQKARENEAFAGRPASPMGIEM